MTMVREPGARQLQAMETRNRLFDCAHELLRSKDFKDITIRDIVRAAGVSTGTFYLYFHSKLDVYYQTYAIADRYFSDVVAPLLDQPTAKERIIAFFDHYAAYNVQQSGLRLAKVLYNSDNRYFNRASDNGMVAILTSVIADGIASGELDAKGTPRELARYLMIAARGVCYDWCSLDGSYDLNAEMRKFIGFFLHAL